MDIDLDTTIAALRDLVTEFLARLPTLVIAILVFIAFVLLSRGVMRLVARATAGRPPNVVRLLSRLARWMVLIFGLLVALMIVAPGFEVAELVGILGIGGVAIGFAFRDILQNFLAGILILMLRPFEVGDQIRVGDFEGVVEDIETRATTIKTYDHRRVVIPNSTMFTESVTVNTAFMQRRSEFDVGIGYEDDIDEAKRLILEAVRSVELVSPEPEPQALTVALDSSSVNIRARWWTQPQQATVVAAHDQVITAIKKRLDAGGINIPFPIRTVYFNDETGYFKPRNGRAGIESAASEA